MRDIQIVYVGAGASGRRTSLAHVLNASGLDVSIGDIYSRYQWRFVWPQDDLRITVTAGVSIARAYYYYEDADDPVVNPEIRAELDLICRADGLLFVIDAQEERAEGNLELFENLGRDLHRRGLDLERIPMVFQVNKQDLEGLCSLQWVRENFHVRHCDYVESIANQGVGTTEALSRLLSLILNIDNT